MLRSISGHRAVLFAGLFVVAGCGSAAPPGSGTDDGRAAAADAGGGARDGSAGPTADVLNDAARAEAAAPPLPSPESMCERSLAPAHACVTEVGAAPALEGGPPPDGTYDRIRVLAPFPPPDNGCPPSQLLLDRGLFKLNFEALGGPFYLGGRYEIDAAAHTMTFDIACSRGSAAYPTFSYAWANLTGELTLFHFGTPWVYRLRAR